MSWSPSSSVELNAARVIKILLPYIEEARKHRESNDGPIVFGLTGLQGSGKSTWAKVLAKNLSEQHQLRTITISLDDLYLCHNDLVRLRDADRKNLLYRTRGQPGTHDEKLAQAFFSSLVTAVHFDSSIQVAAFDKSRFNGEGDRVPKMFWPTIYGPIDIVVFEGWCVGFQPLALNEVKKSWSIAVSRNPLAPAQLGVPSTETLALHRLEDLIQVNNSLRRYCEVFMGPQHFDMLVHLDTDDLVNVYRWRMQQEELLVKAKGTGMTREQVVEFIKGYMPSYELYLDGLRKGFFCQQDTTTKGKKAHIRLLLDAERRVVDVQKL